jgi:hypothetical protein
MMKNLHYVFYVVAFVLHLSGLVTLLGLLPVALQQLVLVLALQPPHLHV